MELISIYGTLVWLFFPLLTYIYFDESSEIGKLYESYMPIDINLYFSYSIPAIIFFNLGLFFRIKNPNRAQLKEVFTYVKANAYIEVNKGKRLIIIGFVANLIYPLTPEIIRNFVFYFSFFSYIGAFYLYFSNDAKKVLYLLFVLLSLLLQTIESGMFFFIIHIGMITVIVFSPSTKTNFIFRLSGMTIIIFIIFFIQSIKGDFRDKTWSSNVGQSKEKSFIESISNNSTNLEILFDERNFYGLVNRMNCGLIVSKAILYVPQNVPFGNGETIYSAMIASLIPRIVWPNKPRTGGAVMICKYLGDCASGEEGNSYNLSLLGESYVNFGFTGGAIFMFFIGLILNLIFNKIIDFVYRHPEAIFYVPLIFISYFSLENDFLTLFNSLTKSIFFIYFIVFKSLKLI
jgi:hypothetical protein